MIDLSWDLDKLTEKLKIAATEIGFFQVINHGVLEDNVDELFHQARKFFNLPQDRKNDFMMDGDAMCGYYL